MPRTTLLLATLAISVLAIDSARGQSPAAARLFEVNCMTCHGKLAGAPGTTALRLLPPETVLRVLDSGPGHERVRQFSDPQKRDIAEYLAGKNLVSDDLAGAKKMRNVCANRAPIANLASSPAWNGWGPDRTNARFQSAEAAGLTAGQIPRLKVKWAFGFPGATAVYGQPTVVAGRVFVGVNTGYVYSLDAGTGCVYWSFQAQAGVRNASSIGPVKGGKARFAAYFGDVRANVYAVDASTGELLWKTRVDDHGLAGVTGAPALYEGRLYVPVSSREEPAGVSLAYPCCTFRGSVVALDANTGKQLWKTYIIPDEPQPTRKNAEGTQLYGPAGGAVWNTPTIDPKRRALYVGTGNNYTEPATGRTDAIVAMSLDTGKVLWSVQDTPKDSWLAGCVAPYGTANNCPVDLGPDYDFGSSPILKSLPNGKRLLIAGQKSGVVLAHDPDRKGAVAWTVQLPKQQQLGEITFGGASDGNNAYFGLKSGGVAAVQLATGEKLWLTPLPGRVGPGGAGETSAVTAIPGVVFSGGYDGTLRAFASDTGKQLWEFNMVQNFPTVNGVAAKGGAMGAPGPTVAGGTLFVGSGYVFAAGGIPGNVLLAFSPE